MLVVSIKKRRIADRSSLAREAFQMRRKSFGALRSMLLNAYGWWKVSQIMWIAAIASFILAGLSLIGSGIGFWLRRTSHQEHTAPPLTPPVPASVA
jgi:uncharacterized membrane protein